MGLSLDWNEYINVARAAVSEGIVLVENNENGLPFKKDDNVAVFGRIQNNYYKSGTGSGGMVNVHEVIGIVEGLLASGAVTINEKLKEVYDEWEKTHPFDKGLGWGNEPWSQEEMPVSEELVLSASKESDVALVIIGRTAGEDKDNTNTKGAFCLTDIELDLLKKVRANFSKMTVLLNTGGIFDMHFVDDIKPDAVLYAWQGGMIGGLGTADILTGKLSPSGKLTDTVAYEITDYPAYNYFGDAKTNFYCEDIYVGYRYFETFAKDRVRYPFGYGLSYTSFMIDSEAVEIDIVNKKLKVTAKVTNTGAMEGKEVVMLYVSAPQGKLGKPDKVLAGFKKTGVILPGDTETIEIESDFRTFASYDDSETTSNPYSFILEQGEYSLFIGNNIQTVKNIHKVLLEETVIESFGQALAPITPFERFKPNDKKEITFEAVPLAKETQEEKISKDFIEEIPYTGNVGITLSDVYEATKNLKTNEEIHNSKIMRDFVGQFSDENLASIIRGEGMGSSLVTPGTASAFGGVSKELRGYMLPAVCCDDGPSGMRFDCGSKAFSLPNGTLLACTFNPELNTKLFSFLALEMIANKVECLLGPGMNIHRYPLNGRNFEYFSEDPLVTGIIAAAQLKGLCDNGVSGTVKHFCGNNQEFKRRFADSVISERALREIYLYGFEMVVRSGYADSIMTSYGRVNGRYTSELYDLNTTILRKEWGFRGVVMTDWWAAIKLSEKGEQESTDFASMAMAQNDLYMVCPDGETNASGDNTIWALSEGILPRAVLQRNAINICDFAMRTEAFKRLNGNPTEVSIIGKPQDVDDFDMSDVEYRVLDKSITIPLDDKESTEGTSYVLAFDAKTMGIFKVSLRGSSNLSELAQMTCTLFFNGFPISTMTFHGTNGELDTITREVLVIKRFSLFRLYVGAKGVDLKDISFEFIKELDPKDKPEF